MDRTTAVQRINFGLGFRPDGWSGEARIILLMQEAQRDLERAKTLPKFLLQEDQTLTLVAGNHTVAYPTGFLRENDDTRIRFTAAGSMKPTFLIRRRFIDAVEGIVSSTSETTAPSVYVIRQSFIDFITTANQNYILTWDYYKKADVLTSNIENAWLADDNGSTWLIGEAGYRMAMGLRDKDAVALFDTMRTQGRAATFGEIIIAEEASGPSVMGANN